MGDFGSQDVKSRMTVQPIVEGRRSLMVADAASPLVDPILSIARLSSMWDRICYGRAEAGT